MHIMMFGLLGYLSGSILFARVFAGLFGKENMIEESADHNPGTSNAFKYGGFWCGVCTLLCDILKGFLPVSLFLLYCRSMNLSFDGLSVVLASPVVGHTFPLWYRLQGGKGIATTFGSLLGIFPVWLPVATLAAFFIFFSVVIKISPHAHRTIITYCCSLLSMACFLHHPAVLCGFFIITVLVLFRMFTSPEEKEEMRIRFLWTH